MSHLIWQNFSTFNRQCFPLKLHVESKFLNHCDDDDDAHQYDSKKTCKVSRTLDEPSIRAVQSPKGL